MCGIVKLRWLSTLFSCWASNIVNVQFTDTSEWCLFRGDLNGEDGKQVKGEREGLNGKNGREETPKETPLPPGSLIKSCRNPETLNH